MNKKNFILSLITLLVMIGGTWIGVFLVKGNTVNPQTGQVIEKGVLSVNSSPNGAAIYINGRLQNATNTSIPFLTTGTYEVRLTKDGYIPWEKQVNLTNDLVTKIDAILWPATPDPNPLTTTGILNATLSPDREKMAYAIKFSEDDKAGLWLMDMNKRAVFNNSSTAFTQLTRNSTKVDYSSSVLTWSPDNTQLLATLTDADKIERNYLIDITRFNQSPADVTLTKDGLLAEWQSQYLESIALQEQGIIDDPTAQQLIANSSIVVQWSYDGAMFLYGTHGKGTIVNSTSAPTNSPSALKTRATMTPAPTTTNIPTTLAETLANNILQTNLRSFTYSELKAQEQKVYEDGTQFHVYDTKKKTSYDVPYALHYRWYPVEEKAEREVQHLMMVEQHGISMIESDGNNKATVYAALYDPNQVFLWPDGGRLIISANYNPQVGAEPNLYTINLH